MLDPNRVVVAGGPGDGGGSQPGLAPCPATTAKRVHHKNLVRGEKHKGRQFFSCI